MKIDTEKEFSKLKLGILGGGQLGKMLVAKTNQWGLNTFILDPDENCSTASQCTTFIKGDFKHYDDVYAFGKQVDILTVEIENVNTEALIQLQKEGKTVYPEPQILQIIQDKGLQKEFYTKHQLATSDYILFENKSEILKAIQENKIQFPFVQKLRKAGYDGKGVAVIKNEKEIENLLDGASVIEDLVAIKKEISVIVARNTNNEIAVYPPVEMTFNPTANLVEYLISPAEVSESHTKQACELALNTIKAFGLTGILAVEMFLDTNDKIYINEVAPRPHNSGHQTIENSVTSQYEQHLRAILGLPLGSTKIIMPSIMLNLLGEQGYTGPAMYQGLIDTMKIEGVNIHLYGKKETRPFRKMGHVTIVDTSIDNAKQKAEIVQKTLKIIS